MKLARFRIRNYKSIVDTGDCYPTGTVTIFAGKNEAGKSSILEALEDFNYGSKIRLKAIPITDPTAKPSIELAFDVPKAFIVAIVGTLKLDKLAQEKFIEQLSEVEQIDITKTYPDEYEIFSEFLSKIPNEKPPELLTLLSSFLTVVNSLATHQAIAKHSLPKLDVKNKNAEDSIAEIDKYKAAVLPWLAELPPDEKEQFLGKLNALKVHTIHHAELTTTALNEFSVQLLKKIPNFVLFSAFDDIFPNEIPLTELKTNKWIADLSAMSDIDVEMITGENRSAKKQHKHLLNIALNKDFSQFWTQDLSKLSVDWDNNTLDFWIEEKGQFYPPELRSQGRRWHLAFYIRVSARARSDVPNIILIDEPGLYLHATAQRDVLTHLEDSSQLRQVLLSTHSPYLIEPEKLDRIRLVQKSDDRGTFVENKIHAVSDKETLTPILTAIGLELNQGIVGANQVDNIVVEGPSDYFYLTALKELTGALSANFISGGCAGNMPKIGTILQGWGCRVIYLYDNDQAFKDGKKSVKKDWAAISKDWLLTVNVEGSIEDVFSKDEFASIVGVDPAEISQKNSVFMKDTRRDKVLPARQFLQKVRDKSAPTLSTQTLQQVTILMNDLSDRLRRQTA
ncbi:MULTISPECIES: AAA family ATPase [unclassified Polaromonas]|uniref:AAA family ATPase n=1 Tax=unclassified Polaromonas TaxID=2638319 RepID=UPI0013DE22B2|nr:MULTISPECIES: AAA family ATPase [unclassified Polaromonas]